MMDLSIKLELCKKLISISLHLCWIQFHVMSYGKVLGVEYSGVLEAYRISGYNFKSRFIVHEFNS